MTALLALESVELSLGGRRVLDGLSLALHPGERLALLGPSGSGKTTLLRLLAGLAVPDRGRVLVEGRVAAEDGRLLLPPERRRIGMVFQELALWPHLSAAGNLELVLRAQGLPRPERRRRALEMLERVGLADRSDSRPAALSGGQRQRVALARALVGRPRALLLDEPMAKLDPPLKARLLAELLEIQEEEELALLYVTHEPREVEALQARALRLGGGRLHPA